MVANHKLGNLAIYRLDCCGSTHHSPGGDEADRIAR